MPSLLQGSIDRVALANPSTRSTWASETAKQLSGEEQDKPSPLPPTATFLTGVSLAEDATPVGGSVSVGARASEARAKQSDGPRYTDSRSLVTETMSAMDLPRISFLRREIQKKASGLDRVEFIMTMATCVAGDISNPVRCIDDIHVSMVANFCEIFAQVDVNNDGTVDWEELSSFMIDMGMKDWAKSGAGTPNYAYAGQVDSARPTQAAGQIQYFPKNDTVAIIEENARFFRVYDARSMHMKRQYDVQDAISAARSVCYCAPGGYYVLGTSASRVCFYEEGTGSVWKDFEAPSIPICLTYSDSHGLLVAGDMIGSIFSWKMGEVSAANTDSGDVPPHHVLGGHMKNNRPPSYHEKNKAFGLDAGHSDAVLSLLALTGTDMVASCSMDHTVKLWDFTTLGLRKTLLGHPKGVKHMAYCPDQRLIVSGGFSYDLVVNNPYLSSPISRLRGHCSSIVGVEHITGTSQVSRLTESIAVQLVTADADGFCKLWDLRTFSCMETFTSNMAANRIRFKTRRKSTCSPATREPSITCMTVSPLSKRVFVGGRSVDSFEVLRDDCEDLTHESAVLAVCFNATNLTFVTASARSVKVWDALKGGLLCADARKQQSQQTAAAAATSAAAAAVESVGRNGEIFSMCLGAKGRTIVTGDGLGHIKVYNQANYTELKNYKYAECKGKAHESNVRALILVEEHSLLVSASSDRSISIHDESKRDGGALLRRITNASWSEITVLRYSSHLGLIASGNTDGSIQLWNFEQARHEGCCEELHQYPVTCLAFLDPFPILLSADAAGYLALWAVPPARVGLRYKRIFTWINKQPVSDRMYGGGGQADGETPVAVTALECQVEKISASIAASTVTDLETLSSVHDDGRHEESTVEMSVQDEDEDDVDVEPNDADEADGEVDAARTDPPAAAAASHTRAARELESGREDGVQSRRHGAGDAAATPLEHANPKTSAEAGRTPAVPEGGGGGEDAAGILPHDADTTAAWDASAASSNPSGGSGSNDRSFQERLAATLRKYRGERRRHPPSIAQSRGDSQEQHQRRVFWNTEMLSYTVYTADEFGMVTTWDLKEVIIGLIHMYGGHEWAGHGVGVVQSPAVYSNAFLIARQDAGNALREARYHLDAKASLDWVADTDILGLHRIGSWEAHSEPIISMSMVSDPPTVITSAMDRLVKLWSPLGDLQGVLRQKNDPDTPWIFRVNRRAQEDHKIRAAERVIMEATSIPRTTRPVAGTANNEEGDSNEQSLLPSCRSHKGCINTIDTAINAFGNAPSNSDKIPPLRLENRHNAVRDDDRDGSDSAEGGSDDGGVSGHEMLVDVSRRPARAHRKYAEEELDRYCESSISSTATKVGPLQFVSTGLLASGDGGNASGRGLRRTPRRVPVRPDTSGKGVTRGRIVGGFGASRRGSASPRAVRGQLVVRQSLSAR